jgi:hypothetical protein
MVVENDHPEGLGRRLGEAARCVLELRRPDLPGLLPPGPDRVEADDV